MAFISMSAKIICKMTSSLSILQLEMTGGSMQSRLRVPMSLSEPMESNCLILLLRKQHGLLLIIPVCVVLKKQRLTTLRRNRLKNLVEANPDLSYIIRIILWSSTAISVRSGYVRIEFLSRYYTGILQFSI